MKKRIKILLSILISVCLFFNISSCYIVNAVDCTKLPDKGTDVCKNFGLEAVTSGPLVNTDLPTVAGNAIKIFIGLSSTIMLIMVLWAGFDIMFTGGDIKKRTAAVNRIVWTSVGIIVIISAYALSQFIINQISFLAK